MKTQKIQGHKNLSRDPESNAVLFEDERSLAEYKKKKKRSLESKVIKEDINNLKEEVKEIKDILSSILYELKG